MAITMIARDRDYTAEYAAVYAEHAILALAYHMANGKLEWATQNAFHVIAAEACADGAVDTWPQ